MSQIKIMSDLNQLIINQVSRFCEENDLEVGKVDGSTRLVGSSSAFDSMDLVNLIVEIEEEVGEHFDKEITLANEKAMSRSTSPFLTIDTLCRYIQELLNE